MDLTVVDELLTTTRSIRRRLDLKRPVDPAVIQECLEIAVQAPIGGDTPRYHFVVVTDARKRAVLADLYRRGPAEIYPARRLEQVRQTKPTLVASVMHLADHFHEVPVLIIPCMASTSGNLCVSGVRGGRRSHVLRAQPARDVAPGGQVCRQDPQESSSW